MSGLIWEQLESTREGGGWLQLGWETHRAKVPGGWLVVVRTQASEPHGVTFYPDPQHKWDGGSTQ